MRRVIYDEDEAKEQRSESRRAIFAFVVLAGLGLLAFRVFVGTVLPIEGEAMAPALHSGDYALMLRGTWGVQRADLVVFETPKSQRTPPSAKPPRDATFRRPASSNKKDLDSPDKPRPSMWIPQQELRRRFEQLASAKTNRGTQEDIGSTATTKKSRKELSIGRVLAQPGDSLRLGQRHCLWGLAKLSGQCLLKRVKDAAGHPFEQFERHLFPRANSKTASISPPTVIGPDFNPDHAGRSAKGVQQKGSVTAEHYLLRVQEDSSQPHPLLIWVPAQAIQGELVYRINPRADWSEDGFFDRMFQPLP